MSICNVDSPYYACSKPVTEPILQIALSEKDDLLQLSASCKKQAEVSINATYNDTIVVVSFGNKSSLSPPPIEHKETSPLLDNEEVPPETPTEAPEEVVSITLTFSAALVKFFKILCHPFRALLDKVKTVLRTFLSEPVNGDN